MDKPTTTHLSNRMFWLLGAGVAVVMLVGTSRELSRPFMGLHSWGKADGARFARAHVVYGLGYTKGLMTNAVGYPPPQPAKHYVNHPHLSPLVVAVPMWVFGPHEGVYRGYWVFMSVLSLLAILMLFRKLLGGAGALLAGLLWSIFPLTAYFGSGGPCFLMAVLAMLFYLRLVGEFGEAAGRRTWLWVGLIVSNFFTLQFSWTGGFYCLALAVHYAGRCILRRQKPHWPMAAVLLITPALSASVIFAIMLAGFNWDYQRIIDLFVWRAGKGEMAATMKTFMWGKWFAKFWEFALTNFTFYMLMLAIVGVLVHVIRRLVAYLIARDTKKRVPLIMGSPQLLLLVMPGVLQLLILRGTLWKHQYWEIPLAPVIAIAGALCLLALWDLLRGSSKPLAAVVVAVVLAGVSVPCIQGANYYYDIRWQHDDRIALWKKLNQLVPANKSLAVFAPGLDGIFVTQSKAKGEVMRAEPAWYIDRPVIHIPTKPEVRSVFGGLGNANAKAAQVMNNLARSLPPNASQSMVEGIRARAMATLRIEVRKLAVQDAQKIVAELESGRSEAPIYLLPCGFNALLAMYAEELSAELSKHFALVYYAPAQPGETDEAGNFFKAGMRAYYVYDVTKDPQESTTSPQP